MREDRLLDAYQRLRRRVRESVRRAREPGSEAGSGAPGGWSTLVEGVATLPDLFHLAIRLLLDRQVPLRRKLPLGLAVAYLVSPLDLVLDAIPVLGWVDDLAVIAWALHRLLDTDDPDIAAAVDRHWAGEGEAFVVVREVLALLRGWAGLRPGR